ncbi:MAG: PorT family protein [Muribaculum sp.]|nr:PorT family protein [Muribaculum sp.]
MKSFSSNQKLNAVLLCLMILLGSVNLEAQTHYSSNVAIGVKGGIETSRVFFNPSMKQKLPIGPTVGIQFRYIEESHFGLIAEVNYARKGWENSFEETDYKYRRGIDYIEIPVLAHVYFGRRGRFFFNVGPQVGFKIGDSTTSNFDYNNVSSLPNFPYKNRVNDAFWLPIHQKVDFGITAGIGGEFSINRRNAVNLEARFYYGIGNLFESGPRDPYRASNDMAVSLTVGYWFRLK